MERPRRRRCVTKDDITELIAAREVARRQWQLDTSLYEAGGGCLGQPFLAPLDGFPNSSNTDQQETLGGQRHLSVLLISAIGGQLAV